MSTRATKVPAIPNVGRSPAELAAAANAMKEAVEVGYGRRGDPLDRFVTVRDLSDAGLVSTVTRSGRASIAAPGGGGGGTDPGAPIFSPGDPDFGENDFTPPPAPKNVVCRGIPPNSIMVTWDPPNYANHSYAEIYVLRETASGGTRTLNEVLAVAGFDRTKPWNATTNPNVNFVGTATGTVFLHSGLTNTANTGEDTLAAALSPSTLYYFVRFVSAAKVPGPFQTSGVGAAGQMSIDPGAVLDAMVTNVRNTPIYNNLRAFLGTQDNGPILSAGGVRAYVNAQDGALQSRVNQQFNVIVGASDPNYTGQSAFARLTQVEGVAAGDHVSLNEVTTWQAALDALATGVTGGNYVNLAATIRNEVMLNVTPTSAIGRSIADVRAQIGTGFGATTQTVAQAVANLDGTLENLWSVRMQQQANGLVFSAGFGLGLSTDSTTGKSLSTFLINANQFAIMGPSAPGALIQGYVRSTSTVATFTLISPEHGFIVPADPANPGPTSSVSIAAVDDDHSPFRLLDGLTGTITAVNGQVITVRITQGTWPTGNASISLDDAVKWGAAMFAQSSIPFIVDTAKGVVGIRGKLIVDGLVRATSGEFNTLSADTAFIRQLQAQVVNANVIIGQRLIAGTPGLGAIDDTTYDSISNFIVELNNPSAPGHPAPLRYWKPSSGQTIFELDALGNVKLGGNLSVGKNAVFRTNLTLPDGSIDTSKSLVSIGGNGFSMWIGRQGDYGQTGEGRTEDNGVLWVRDQLTAGGVRAGFNADLFLGKNALALPVVAAQSSSNPNPGANYARTGNTVRADNLIQKAVSVSPIVVRALRDGTVASTVVQVAGNLVSHNSGETNNGDDKLFDLVCELIGSPAADSPALAVIQSLTLDDYSPEAMPFCLLNVVQVPAGSYWVRLTVTRYDDRNMSIIKGWNVVAYQAAANGAFAATTPSAPERLIASPARLELTNHAPDGLPGEPWHHVYAPTGGTAPYAVTIATGELPGGATLLGNVADAPAATGGTYTYQVLVIDAAGAEARLDETVKIEVPSVNLVDPADYLTSFGWSVAGTELTYTLSGNPFTYNLTDTLDSGDTATLTADITNIGNDGMQFRLRSSSTGNFQAFTPINHGTEAYAPDELLVDTNGPYDQLRIVDQDDNDVVVIDNVVVLKGVAAPATLTLTGTFAVATFDEVYSSDLTITGGTAPYTLTGGTGVTSGTLPAGVTLSIVNESGVDKLRLSGRTTAVSSGSVEVSVDSSDAQAATHTQTITAQGDPNFGDVVSMSDFNGSQGSTTISDDIGCTWVCDGLAQLDQAVKEYGSASLNLTNGGGASNSTLAGLDLGTGDYFFEVTGILASLPGSGGVAAIAGQYLAGGNLGWLFYIYNDGTNYRLCFDYSLDGSSGTVGLSAIVSLSIGVRQRFALGQQGGTIGGFVEGLLVGTASQVSAIHPSAGSLTLGHRTGSGAWQLDGHLDGWRATVGTCRHTAGYDPATQPFATSL